MKNQKGITLIALVITIIVLLILAGVSISMVIGDNGIIKQANDAKSATILGSEQEQVELAYISAKTKKLGGSVTKDDLEVALNENLVNATVKIKEGTTDVLLVEFVDTQNQYEIDGEIVTKVESSIGGGNTGTTPEPVEIPEGLALGDMVAYYSNGSYRWESQYAYSETVGYEYYDLITGTATPTGTPNRDMSINTWRVYSIDESTGEIELVPYEATEPLELQGAQGYNNGVKLLNDACSALYSDSSKGITARSVNFEDIINYYDEDTFIEYYKTKYFESDGYDAYAQLGLDRNFQLLNPIAYPKYPAIYEQEELSTIKYTGNPDEVKIAKGAGLARSEQTSFISKTHNGASNGIISTNMSIRPYISAGYFNVNDMQLFGESGEYLNASESYWIATRAIDDGFGLYKFIVGYTSSNSYVSATNLMYTNGNEGGSKSCLFPIVKLKANLLENNTEPVTEWKVK